MPTKNEVEITSLLIAMVDPPIEPDRMDIDSDYIQELSKSIAAIGQLTPVLVRPVNGRYEIVAGHRRWMALKVIGKAEIKALVREMNDTEVKLARATENIQRKNLTPIEEAKIYARLHNTCDMSWEEIAKYIGKSLATVKRRYDLLSMAECLQTALHKKQISAVVAECLATLVNVSRIEYFLSFAIDHGATLPVVQQWVNDEKKEIRRQEFNQDGGGFHSPLPESKPLYIACDLCMSPTELGTEKLMRICKGCYASLMKMIKEQ